MVLKYLKKILQPRPDAASHSPEDPGDGPPSLKRVHRPIPLERIDGDAIKILKRLSRHGHEAYLVGGGVRDLLLGFLPKDFDVATSARPHEVKRLFRNCRVIGRRFRLAHIYFQGKIIEVATFRAPAPEPEPSPEGDLLIRSDNEFGTPEQDALRRDFSLNALFYDVETETILDYVGGLADLEARRIRAIGDPDVRLQEDPIRILRAIRLSARLGCEIETRTREAILAHRSDITRSAMPRILEDLLRMFRGGAAEAAFRQMRELGVLEVVFPELGAYLERAARPDGEAFFASLGVLDEMAREGQEATAAVQLAVLLTPLIHEHLALKDPPPADPTKEIATFVRPIAQRMGISRRDSDRLRLIVHAMSRFIPGRRPRRFSERAFARRPFFAEALCLFEVFCRANGELLDELARWKETHGAEAAASSAAAAGGRQQKRREMGEKGAQTAPIRRDRRRGRGSSGSRRRRGRRGGGGGEAKESQGGGRQGEKRGGGRQDEKRGGGRQDEKRGGGRRSEKRGGGRRSEKKGGGGSRRPRGAHVHDV
jgi:poly(A) polymerase